MAVSYPVTPPSSPKAVRFALEFQPNTASARSIFTKEVQTYVHDGLVWAGSITLPPLLNTTQARDWHGFLVSLNGLEGTFTYGPVQHATPSGTQAADIALRSAAAIGAQSIEVDGMTASATLLRGDMISIASRLYMLTEDATANGSGEADLTLSHPLRAAAANNDTVTILNPVGTWRLSDPNVVRQIVPGGVSQISFSVVEAI